MKRALLALFWCVFAISLNAQNYIGEHKLIIKKRISEEYKNFHFTKEVTSSSHHFIKFEEANGDKTLLCVLDQNGYCEYCMLMCDYSFLKSATDSLDGNYENIGNMQWIDKTSGTGYLITLKKEEWYFTLVTKKKN